MSDVKASAEALEASLTKLKVDRKTAFRIDPLLGDDVQFTTDAPSAHMRLEIEYLSAKCAAALRPLPLINLIKPYLVFTLYPDRTAYVDLKFINTCWTKEVGCLSKLLTELEQRLAQTFEKEPDAHPTHTYGLQYSQNGSAIVGRQRAGSPRQAVMLYSAVQSYGKNIRASAKNIEAVYRMCAPENWVLK
jgi:hypothetical protein